MKCYTRVAVALNLVLCLTLPPSALAQVDFEQVNTTSPQTLSNKTLQAPVLSGTLTGTYTLGGTPTYGSGGIFSLPTISDQLSLADGTALAPSVRFTNSITTGFYRIGIDRLGIATAATNALEINASQNFIIPTGKTFTVGSNVLFGAVADKLNAQYLAIASQAIGDLLCADSTTTFSRLADIATTNVLRSGGVGACPAYGKVVLTTDVSGILPQTNGGTALSSSGTANQVLGENAAANALEYKTLTAGSGVTIVHSAGAVTFSASPSTLRSYLAGFIMSTAGGSGTMTVAAGQATDSTQVSLINLASAINKTTSAWASGTNNGGLDTGAIANSTWYYFFACSGSVGTDVFFSLSPGSPTAPATCNVFRRIGAGRTDGSAHWILFTQKNRTFRWSASVLDLNAVSIADTNAHLATLTVPPLDNLEAIFNVILLGGGAANNSVYVSSPNNSDEAVSTTLAPFWNIEVDNVGNGDFGRNMTVGTNASGQIRYRALNASNSISLATLGWIDYAGLYQ